MNLGGLLHGALNVASAVPGPWQVPAIAANAGTRIGEHAYRRAHDDRYFKNSKGLGGAVDPIMDAAMQIAMAPRRPNGGMKWWEAMSENPMGM